MNAVPQAAQRVLDFWFGPVGSAEYGQQREVWFRKDTAVDTDIAHRFGSLIEAALAGGLRDWAGQAESALARIVLLDQFTRNVFRATPRAFAGDALALAAARAMVAAKQDEALLPVQRSFVYLPFEHAEDIAAQDESLRLFDALVRAAPELAGFRDYAQRHRDIVARFGRFPHRNAVLGRESTPEEIAFLREPGSGF